MKLFKKTDFKKLNPKKTNFKFKGKGRTLLRTLSVAFMVPVVLTVILGVVSYNVASNSIISTYKETAKATVCAEADYFELICESISKKALELVLSSDTATFYSMYYKDKTAAGFATQLQATKKELSNLLSTNDQIFSYTVIPDQGASMSSLNFKIEAGEPYEGFKNSPEGLFFDENKATRNGWFGYHTYIDEFSNSDTTKYVFTYIQRMTRGDNYLILDMKQSAAEEMLKNLNFGDNSYVGLISRDGREVAMECGTDMISELQKNEGYVISHGFYKNIAELEETYSEDIRFNGKKYMFIAEPVEGTGIVIYALIPQANATSQVRSIRTITFILVAAAVVIALAIGYFISTGISKAMRHMSRGLEKAANGDLTRVFKTYRKDEFATLTASLNTMITGIHDVMVDMKEFSKKVSGLSNDVSKDSVSISEAAFNTTKVMDEVAKGIMDQASNTEPSNRLMSSFSENIAEVADRTTLMGSAADEVMGAVEEGRSIVSTLNKQSGATVKLTQELLEDIKEVERNSLEIQSFVNVISDISEETNLLSLNASIEAARAGEAGRGFSVVADEIRKLADQSMESGNNINRFAAIIEETTKKTTESAKKTEKMIMEQAQSLEETVEVFTRINESVEALVKDLKETLTKLQKVDEEKNGVQSSLQNISTVSEEVAASGEEVTATLTQQAEIIAQLSAKAMELNEDADKLNEAIAKFTV